MATFQPRAEVEEFDFATTWREQLDNVAPGGIDTFTNGAGDASLVVYLEASDPQYLPGLLRSATWKTLGYSWADDGTPWALHRHAPASHPLWGPSYRATQVGFQLVAPKGNTANTNNAPYLTSEVAFDTVTRLGQYKAAFMTVRFSGPQPFYYFEDDSAEWASLGSHEWDRYTVLDMHPKVETISATNTRFLYFVDGPTNDPKNNSYPGEAYERVIRSEVTLDWFEVPRSYLFGSDGAPQKILDSLGRVMSLDWLGFAKQTLLLEGVRMERKVFPFATADNGRPFFYDVRFFFNHADPKPGAGSSTTDRGWRLLPWRTGGNATGNGGAVGGAGWYSVRRGGTSASNPTYLEEIDMSDETDGPFAHVDA
jgi:hypothetical protein